MTSSPTSLDSLRERALLLDLEVSLQGRILKLGAVLSDRSLALSATTTAEVTLRELDGLAGRAAFVLGHNLVRHDLKVLRERAPQHPVLLLPVIDTLVLSPICFPENPYHRLVKDYKLVKESVNDPVADARQAAGLFEDEFKALAGLSQTEPGLFALLHFLLTTSDVANDPLARGMALVFEALGGSKPSEPAALEICRKVFRRWGCAAVPVDKSLVSTSSHCLTLAFVVSWLRVAGANSVLPPWVRLEHPLVNDWIKRLREAPCSLPDCAYCRKTHNAREQLRLFFGFDQFRGVPAKAGGGSLQQEIVEAGMRNESMLAILPTGGGKSLCFQLPALVRNFRRGMLTVVISPLQALMKDQVDGLVRRTGTPFAAALYGLLTPPERGDVLRRIRLGDVALLYVSPEQLRNRSFRDAIAQREIGCWVFDEAHCLSKWGHDFRPDYLYAGRFIREFSKGGDMPPIACFTATAKRDVKREILAYFKTETGRELRLYEGGVERDNLGFEVQTITGHGKLERIDDLLRERLGQGGSGSSIVFRATRADTEIAAQFLQTKSWKAAHFHAGLTPSEKKRVQDEFLDGELQVICATNAFGMGIDKEDVRLVIHADTPGSLENYLQEAGRAGRDGQRAECILLYDQEDCERQFRMEAFSELSRKDIAQILRGLRKAGRATPDKVVITSGEILRDEDVATEIDLEDRDADSKVRTAISWLERAGFIERDENVTNVFQARLLVRDLKEAETKMAALSLALAEKALWIAVLREFMNAASNESLTVDRLALLPEFVAYAQRGAGRPGAKPSPEFVSGKILKLLGSMAKAELLKRDTLLNAYVRHKVADHSRLRLERVLLAERKLLDLLAIEAPDPEGWMALSVRLLNQRLCDDQIESSAELIRLLLKSLSEDGRGFAGTRGSIDMRYLARDNYRVRVNRSWTAIQGLAEKRWRVASLVLEVLLAKIPIDEPPGAERLVEFSFEELGQAIERDGSLRAELKDLDAGLERALMYLHEQHVIALQHGLAVFRSAMTIRLQPNARGAKYTNEDYQPLAHHYQERVFQVHVMSEYAQRGVQFLREALSLVLAYFSLEKEEFIRRYLSTKPDLLEHATTAQSFQRIVSELANPAQMKVVTAPADRNMLILAGPGSGKTRTVVHRCAYLLRVKRARPQHILVCCFNRRAAQELRRRLAELVGADARGVTVLTYHALAMRLLGYSFAGRSASWAPEFDFDALIQDAVKLLRGERVAAGLEPDEIRERLLAGYQYILVDEYQDIDEPQYQMIGAIAGRTIKDSDLKLSILAVGDDDQNIYTFRGANVKFIRQFRQDYQAEVYYLIENYRSTKYIIEAANQLIAANSDRMKTYHAIRIDGHRTLQSAGGEFGKLDELTRGRVQVIRVANAVVQAQAVISELRRLHKLGITDWSRMAVLSSRHPDLAQVRALAEQAEIPIRWSPAQGAIPALHQIREIRRFLENLNSRRNTLARGSELVCSTGALVQAEPDNLWLQFLARIVEAWRIESNDSELPVQEAIEFLHETCAESRRDFSYGQGVTFGTVHSAKGAEYDHVLLIGDWRLKPEPNRQEEQRRVFYVGMTRARQSLAIFDRDDLQPPLPGSLEGPAVLRWQFEGEPRAPQEISVSYATLGLADIHLGYPARFGAAEPIHAALAALRPGAKLSLQPIDSIDIGLFDSDGTCVSVLSAKGREHWRKHLESIVEVRVLAMVYRNQDQETEPVYRERCLVREWEIPVVEVVFKEDRQPVD